VPLSESPVNGGVPRTTGLPGFSEDYRRELRRCSEDPFWSVLAGGLLDRRAAEARRHDEAPEVWNAISLGEDRGR